MNFMGCRFGSLSGEMIRFCVVGFFSNSLLYLFYLFFTFMGVGYKTAMTLIFVVGVLQTFLFNKRWTFGCEDVVCSSFTRYALAYVFAYVLDLMALFFFSDCLGYEHQIVQGVMIFFVAIILFVLQKFWVFRVSIYSGS